MEKEGHNFRLLKKRLLKYSVGDDWQTARTEWETYKIIVYAMDDTFNEKYDENLDGFIKEHKEQLKCFYGPNECICKHYIQAHCFIKNKLNNNIMCVGNTCINYFNQDMYDVNKKIFGGVKKLLGSIKKYKIKSLDSKLLDYCVDKNIITDDDRELLMRYSKKNYVCHKEINEIPYKEVKKIIKLHKKIIKELTLKDNFGDDDFMQMIDNIGIDEKVRCKYHYEYYNEKNIAMICYKCDSKITNSTEYNECVANDKNNIICSRCVKASKYVNNFDKLHGYKCPTCENIFYRLPTETYKKVCVPCYKKSNNIPNEPNKYNKYKSTLKKKYYTRY